MNNTIWRCKIGVQGPLLLPAGADYPMRRAVEAEFRRLTGVDPEFTFSGWSAQLTEGELAVVEDRMPEHDKLPVTITVARYNELRNAEEELAAINALGVDNWEGYDEVEWPESDKDYSAELYEDGR